MIEAVISSGSGEAQSFNILISLTEKSCHLIAAQSRREESVVIIFKEPLKSDSCEVNWEPPLLDLWRNAAVISLMFGFSIHVQRMDSYGDIQKKCS